MIDRFSVPLITACFVSRTCHYVQAGSCTYLTAGGWVALHSRRLCSSHFVEGDILVLQHPPFVLPLQVVNATGPRQMHSPYWRGASDRSPSNPQAWPTCADHSPRAAQYELSSTCLHPPEIPSRPPNGPQAKELPMSPPAVAFPSTARP